MKHVAWIFIGVATLGLTACASTPDPAKVCTAEWIAPRADKAVNRIEKRAKSSLKAVTSAAKTWSTGGTPGPIQMFRLSRSLKSLEKELTEGRGITDIKTLAKTCDDPELVNKSVMTLLERQGVSPDVLEGLEDNPFFKGFLDSVINASDTAVEATDIRT